VLIFKAVSAIIAAIATADGRAKLINS